MSSQATKDTAQNLLERIEFHSTLRFAKLSNISPHEILKIVLIVLDSRHYHRSKKEEELVEKRKLLLFGLKHKFSCLIGGLMISLFSSAVMKSFDLQMNVMMLAIGSVIGHFYFMKVSFKEQESLARCLYEDVSKLSEKEIKESYFKVHDFLTGNQD